MNSYTVNGSLGTPLNISNGVLTLSKLGSWSTGYYIHLNIG